MTVIYLSVFHLFNLVIYAYKGIMDRLFCDCKLILYFCAAFN